MKPTARVDRRLEDLAEVYAIEPRGTAALRVLLDCLASDRAPTSVRDPALGVDAHVADSLAALGLPLFEGAPAIADLGAGAGVPGLVLAAARPRTHVALVESVGRKADFIEGTAERMRLANVEVVRARAEEWRAGLRACDVVTARALAALPVLVEYAAPLLRLGGSLAAWKGAVTAEEATHGHAAAAATGLERTSVHPVRPFGGAEKRTLHVYLKVMETPVRFPRRAGMAVKRPLSATS